MLVFVGVVFHRRCNLDFRTDRSGMHQAGLFSAILTAFNVQSYILLTPDPDPDPIISALEKISAQLESFSVNLPSVNATQPAFVYRDPSPPSPPGWAVWLNALWFSSLIFSMSAASIGIMVKQWLNEYSSGLSGTSRQIARLRQLRLNSLQRWRVQEIVSVLPVLLQIASGLFFAGLLTLLWQLNRAVAIVSSVLVGVLAAFTLITIVLPSLATHCSYLSPPSRAFYELTRPLRSLLYLCRHHMSSWVFRMYRTRIPSVSSTEKGQSRLAMSLLSTLGRLLFTDDSSSTLKWRGKERFLVTKHGAALDGDTVAAAYATGLDTSYAPYVVLCTTELTIDAARRCFKSIRLYNLTHWGPEGERPESMRSVHACMWSGAIITLMAAAPGDDLQPFLDVQATLDDLYYSIGALNPHAPLDSPWTRLLCVDVARLLRHYDDGKLPPAANAEDRLNDDLQWLMEKVSGSDLGNDVRHHSQYTSLRSRSQR